MAPTGRQRRVAAATALLILAGATGCTGGDREDPAQPPGQPGPTGTSSPAATGSPRTDPARVAQEYSTTPQEYAERTVAAWAAPDLLRLAELAVPEVHERLVELPGPPDLTWTFIRCAVDPPAGASNCAFFNQDGDRLVLAIDHERLGEPRAAVGMEFKVTPYPDDPLAYLRVFVTAWQEGNLGRMQNLAAPAAVEVFAQLPAPEEVDYQVGEQTGRLVEVQVTGAPEGTVLTEVSTVLLGEPQAIRTAALEAPTSSS